MLANIAVLRTVKANVNEAIMVALPSILFESSHDKKDTQKYYLQGPAAEYIPVENAGPTHFRVYRKRGNGRKRCAGIRCKHR